MGVVLVHMLSEGKFEWEDGNERRLQLVYRNLGRGRESWTDSRPT